MTSTCMIKNSTFYAVFNFFLILIKMIAMQMFSEIYNILAILAKFNDIDYTAHLDILRSMIEIEIEID